MRPILKVLLPLAAALTTLPAAAFLETPTLGKVNVPASAKAGEQVTITVEAAADSGKGSCGLFVEYGDGKDEQIKVKDGFPVTLQHAYKAAGKYTVKASGKQVTTHSACKGNVQADVQVAGGAAASATAAAPTCPSGWSLVKVSVKKTGAYTCQAMPPAEALQCPAKTKYFAKGGTVGCK